MRQCFHLFAVLVIAMAAQNASAVVIDFEATPLGLPATPLTEDGFDVVSSQDLGAPVGVFDPTNPVAVSNGTNILGWCGSCGTLQVISVAPSGGGVFSAQSVDATNLWRVEEDVAGVNFQPGMTLDVTGHLNGGGTVTQSLTIVEDTFQTFALIGFNNLTQLDFNVGGVQVTGAPVTSDPVIDNIVLNMDAIVPEPATAVLGMLGVAMIGLRRRR